MFLRPILITVGAFAITSVTRTSFCRAETVRFQMTGTILVSDPFHLLPEEIHTGAPFLASVAWDTSVPDANPDPFAGYYPHPPADPMTAAYGMWLQIGPHLIRADTSSGFPVGVTSGEADPLHADSVSTATITPIKSFDFNFPYAGDEFFEQISLFLRDGSGTALSDDSLPTYLNPGKFAYHGEVYEGVFGDGPFGTVPDAFGVIGVNGTHSVLVGDQPPIFYQIGAIIQNIIVVPEPSSGSLAIFAALVAISAVETARLRQRRAVN